MAEKIDISLTCMPLDELRALFDGSPMSDKMKAGVKKVLCDGWSCTSAAELKLVKPSALHRACRGVLARRMVDGKPVGPEAVFAAWYAARCVLVPDTETERGTRVRFWSLGAELRADLAQWEPGVAVSHVVFGRCMQARGHLGAVYRGGTRYPCVRLADGLAIARHPAKPTRAQQEAANPEAWHNGHRMRLENGAMYTNPHTGKPFESDDQLRAHWDALDAAAAAERARVEALDAGGDVVGSRLALGVSAGKKRRGGEV